jgi:hypothetical protein
MQQLLRFLAAVVVAVTLLQQLLRLLAAGVVALPLLYQLLLVLAAAAVVATTRILRVLAAAVVSLTLQYQLLWFLVAVVVSLTLLYPLLRVLAAAFVALTLLYYLLSSPAVCPNISGTRRFFGARRQRSPCGPQPPPFLNTLATKGRETQSGIRRTNSRRQRPVVFCFLKQITQNIYNGQNSFLNLDLSFFYCMT